MMGDKSARFTAFAWAFCLLWLTVSTAVGQDATQPPAGGAADAVEAYGDDALVDGEISMSRLMWHVPDPEDYRARALEELDRARTADDKIRVQYIERVLDSMGALRRERQVRLSLDDVVRRTMQQSYAVEIQRFNPAIETTRVVEAEAAFDAVFFTNITRANIDQPSGSQLSATEVDQFTSAFGVRKRLATGTQVSGTWNMNRQSIGISFQNINPEYKSTFTLEARQPLLRGAGIDYNRSQITLAQNNQALSEWVFRRQVRDTLRRVEELYWRLVQTRRDLLVTARVLADFEAIFTYLEARKAFDVVPVQLAATEANLEQSRADFIRRRAAVFDAQDRLLALMNDPELPLGGDAEVIPADFPQIDRFTVSPLAEVQTALDNRSEIREQELQIANARIAVGRAKNFELPRLDATFRYSVEGLWDNADRAFDKMSTHNFITYYVGVEFELPIGNRAARAAHARSKLQHAQATAALQGQFEEVILDVHEAARELTMTYDQIWPSFKSAQARTREVDSVVARAERKDFNTLNSELGARRSLASERSAMLNAMVNYNIAIIDLERAKGTLLRYNNVVITPPSE